jgi:hypothetical protein
MEIKCKLVGLMELIRVYVQRRTFVLAMSSPSGGTDTPINEYLQNIKQLHDDQRLGTTLL